jgi:hypothetical protein
MATPQAVFALWKGDCWEPHAPYDLHSDTYPIGEWPDWISERGLPKPRFQVGDHIVFPWCEGYLEGTIDKITCYWSRNRNFFISGREWDIKTSITLGIREKGHYRETTDDGKKDIRLGTKAGLLGLG